tara:strand:- start:306 stop:1451 length:1146 start_codon:yes stop_codon:yes gene_type:complete
MAVNKNFVVKNGLEVATDVILADASTKNVGLGSTSPQFTLDVRGGIGATDIKATGFTTATQGLQVGTSGSIFYVSDTTNNVGVGTSVPNPIYTLDVRSSVSTGQTALYVYGDMRVTGDINLDDITLDDAEIQNLTVTDTLFVSGLSTFSSDVELSTNLNVSGIATAASLNILGVTTSNDLLVTGVTTVTQLEATGIVTTVNLNVTGVTTSTDKEIYNQFDITNDGSSAYQFAATGIGFTEATNNPTLYLTRGKNYRFSVNASSHPFYIKTVNSTGVGNSYNDGVTNNGAEVGIVTFKVPYNAPDILHYNCQHHSGMHGEIRVGGAGAGVGVGSEGSFIGAGATMIDFKSSNGGNTVDITSGIATVTVQTGVSLGLAIALGG